MRGLDHPPPDQACACREPVRPRVTPGVDNRLRQHVQSACRRTRRSDPARCQTFRLCWLVVGPFSALSRRHWLRAVDARASLFVPKPSSQTSVVRILVSNLGLSVRQRPLVYVGVCAIVTQLVTQPRRRGQCGPVRKRASSGQRTLAGGWAGQGSGSPYAGD